MDPPRDSIVLKMHKSEPVALVLQEPVSFDDSKFDGRYQPPRFPAQTKPGAYTMYGFISNLF